MSFRHSGWQPSRHRIRDALERCDVAQSRLDAWDECGARAWVLRSKDHDDRYKVASTTCRDRFCVPCADDRSAKIGRRVRDRIPSSGISFLTLTLADNDVPLSELLDKLIRSFRRLRQWDRWKADVKGGVAFIEIKWNAKSDRWHPHIHAIMEADFLPQSLISAEWHRITKTSFVVDIRRPKNSETVIRYVTKYGSKPLNHSFVADADRLDEAIRSLKGRHMCTAFGTWREWALHDDDEHEQWEPVDTLENLIARASRGDPQALKIMEAINCTIPNSTTPEASPRPPPSDPPSPPLSLVNARHFASDVAARLRVMLTT